MSFEGTIVSGHKRGRKLGFPTANLSVTSHHSLPGDGVYACWVRIDGEASLRGATTSIGFNPTFDDVKHRQIEVHIHGLMDDIYQRSIVVWIVSFLRPMERFASIQELITQTAADVNRSSALLAGPRES